MRLVSLAVVLALASGAAVAQCQWQNPPPFPNGTWARDLRWHFSGANWQVPETHFGPTWDSPPDWTCDEIRIDPGLEITPMGEAIRVDNPTQGALELAFHINNYDNCNPIKVIWVEMIWENPNGLNAFDLRKPGFGDFVIQKWEQVGPINWSGEIVRNPPFEELVWMITPGSYVYLWDLHVRTDCVPEPTGLLALAAGLGLLLRRRR
ncbi:MAG: PEP-CTERM sorting domain-containing protein [Armatimonadota bacterium]